MSSSVFHIKEHELEAQHIREYPRATNAFQEDIFKIAIKQYTPIDNPDPQPGDVTIIGAHANGIPKECYEPLWDEIHARSKKEGFRIRGVWIADVSNQGHSLTLNEQIVGNDPNWFDHSRDLLHMVNTFRSEMPLPLVGIGHSQGGVQLIHLAHLHPRLLTTLILMEPAMIPPKSFSKSPGEMASRMSTFRRDLWPSKEVATASFQKSPFLKIWDRRVFARWLEFGLRETPTALHPDANGAVTLTTPRHQEVFSFLRPLFNDIQAEGVSGPPITFQSHPDVSPTTPKHWHGYRAEGVITFHELSTLRPSVQYIFGKKSDFISPVWVEQFLHETGTGHGGSGGVQNNRVEKVGLEGCGHLLAMEAPNECADIAVSWIGKELKLWQAEAKVYQDWTKNSYQKKTTMSQEWVKRMGGNKREKAKI